MTKIVRSILLLFLLLTIFLSVGNCSAFPSSGYTESNGYWFDDWNINRNYYDGSNGYLPNMAYETLDENKDTAYGIGEYFKDNYPLKTERASAILRYVQRWTEYGHDEEYVFMNGIAQEEWAWNADEMANSFDENMGTIAIGDCEDLAFLCGTIYTGAGIDAAVVDAPGHVGLLIWLPEYANADNYWDIPNDNRGSGWIWVEATAGTNPVGWTPPDYKDGQWTAYPLGDIAPIDDESTPAAPSMDLIIPAIVIFLIVAVLLVISKSKSKQKNQCYVYTPPPPPPPPPPY